MIEPGTRDTVNDEGLGARGEAPAAPPPSAAASHDATAAAHAAIAAWGKRPDTPAAIRAAQALASLLDGNRRFVAGTPAPRNLLKERACLVSGQRPIALVLTCSDSRVAIEDTFDVPLGTLFGVMTAGACVDVTVVASVEFGVAKLQLPLVLVMGHDDCGAVDAARRHDTPAGALGALVTQVRASVLNEPSVDTAIDQHTRRTAGALVDGSSMLATAHAAGALFVVPARYRLAEGRVDLLPPRP